MRRAAARRLRSHRRCNPRRSSHHAGRGPRRLRPAWDPGARCAGRRIPGRLAQVQWGEGGHARGRAGHPAAEGDHGRPQPTLRRALPWAGNAASAGDVGAAAHGRADGAAGLLRRRRAVQNTLGQQLRRRRVGSRATHSNCSAPPDSSCGAQPLSRETSWTVSCQGSRSTRPGAHPPAAT